MHRTVTLALGAMSLANGAVMLVAPELWARVTPGVPAPFNAHMVRDVGIAFMVAGGGLLWMARDISARPAAIAGASFLAMHAGLHVVEGLLGMHGGVASPVAPLLRDFPGVHLPAALAVWVATRAPSTPSAADADAGVAATPRGRMSA